MTAHLAAWLCRGTCRCSSLRRQQPSCNRPPSRQWLPAAWVMPVTHLSSNCASVHLGLTPCQACCSSGQPPSLPLTAVLPSAEIPGCSIPHCLFQECCCLLRFKGTAHLSAAEGVLLSAEEWQPAGDIHSGAQHHWAWAGSGQQWQQRQPHSGRLPGGGCTVQLPAEQQCSDGSLHLRCQPHTCRCQVSVPTARCHNAARLATSCKLSLSQLCCSPALRPLDEGCSCMEALRSMWLTLRPDCPPAAAGSLRWQLCMPYRDSVAVGSAAYGFWLDAAPSGSSAAAAPSQAVLTPSNAITGSSPSSSPGLPSTLQGCPGAMSVSNFSANAARASGQHGLRLTGSWQGSEASIAP